MKQVELDDMQVGLYITVWKGKRLTHNSNIFSIFDSVTTETQVEEIEDNSFKGDVLKIIAIDAPFIAVHHVRQDRKLSFDTREWKFAKLSDDYMKALLSSHSA